MNRRAFLRQVSIAAASGLLLPEIARELMAPARTIFLPPRAPLTLTAFLGPMPRGLRSTWPEMDHWNDAFRYLQAGDATLKVRGSAVYRSVLGYERAQS